MKRICAVVIALLMILPSAGMTAYAASKNVPITIHNLTTGYPKDVSYNQQYTNFEEAYADYVDGYEDDVFEEDSLQFAENDVACLELHGEKAFSFSLSDENAQIEIVHNTSIILREAYHTINEVPEVTVTVDTPIVVKSGNYLILRSTSYGHLYEDIYTTVQLNCPIIVEAGATLLLDGPNITGYPTGPRDVYVGPESGPAIIAEEGATVRLGGVILQPDENNTDPFIQAEGAAIIVQAGNSIDTTSTNGKTGALPAVDQTYYHSNTYAETSGSAPIIAATEGTTVQLLGGNLVSEGDMPAITVDGSSSIQIDMENESWTNKHGQGTAATEAGVPAISIASGGALKLGGYAPATAGDNETQAIELAPDVAVEKGGMSITVSNDTEGDNYVDNYGNIVLAAGASLGGADDTLNAAVILPDGTIVEGSGTEAPKLEVSIDDETGETTTKVTVPAGGSVQKPDEEKQTLPNGGGVTSTTDGTDITPNPTPVDPTPVDPTPSKPSVDDDDDDDGYPVSVPSSSSIKNGSITVSPRSADKGDTVTITVRPKDGYELDELAVTDASGKAIEYTDKGNGKYTFTMPASRVKVDVSFAKIAEARRFTDVPDGYWAEDEISWAAENGYINGNTATTYNPEGPVTRQQLWMILARLSGYQPADFAAAKAWAVDNGISDGTIPGTAITRQQLVTILYRWAEKMGYSVEGSADLTAFPDHASVADYAQAPMSWSVANGIIGGTARGTLAPAGTTTRAQFAVILYRFCENIVK